MCVSYSSTPLIFIGRRQRGFSRQNQQVQHLNRLREASRKLHAKAEGRLWGPPVGRPVGPTTGHWPGSFLVGPFGLATCLSFCNVGFLGLVGPLIHVMTRVMLRFIELLYLGS